MRDQTWVVASAGLPAPGTLAPKPAVMPRTASHLHRLSRGGAAARPQALDALEGVAFRFRDVQVNEARGEHAHGPVYPVGETVIEQVVEDRISVEDLEGPGNEQVGDPLGGDRDGKGTVLDRVRKHLREQHPGYRSPRQRKPGAVNHHRA